MNSRLLCVAAFVVGSSIVVAACGGSGGSGSVSAAGSTTTTVAGGSGARTAFRDCLRKQGVDLPAGFANRPRGGSGAPGRPPGSFPAGAGGQKFQKAFQACRGSLPAGGFGGRRGGRNPQQLEAYMSCLRDHGVKVPAITPGSTPGSTPPSSRGGGRFGLGSVRNDPKFAAANQICRPLLPTFGGATTTTTTADATMSKRFVLNGFLVLVVAGLGIGTFATVRSSSSSAATTQTFATAKRGIVLQSVTSTGNVEAPTNLSLSFLQSGEVTKIMVAAGEHVGAGQALATVDDTQQKMALASSQASLASAQASLAALRRGETAIERQADAQSAISAAQSVTTAQQGLTSAQQSAQSNVTKYEQAMAQAQQSVSAANAGVANAQVQLDQADVALTSLQNSSDPGRSAGEQVAATITRYRLDQVSCGSHTADPAYHPSDGVNCLEVANLLAFAQSSQSAQTGLTSAQTQRTTAQNGLTSARQAQTSGEIQDRQAVQNAQSQLTSAQNQYNSTVIANAVKEQPPKPEQLAQAQASVTSSEAQLATAEKNEHDTTLRAPVAGVVAAVNGLVGQQSGSGGASSASSSASSASSSASSSSSSSGFVTLADVSLLDVSVGFTETDAPKVHVGQVASITLDALPNQTFSGHVIELDTESTLVSNVVTYYAKVAFDSAPDGVKPGMTASVNVVLDKRDDAITLPTSAVSTTGTSATVTVKPKSGPVTTRTITIGLRGDNAVEITGGLSVGDQVVITTAASTSSGGFPGGGGLGGGFGGGLGGGGRGRG